MRFWRPPHIGLSVSKAVRASLLARLPRVPASLAQIRGRRGLYHGVLERSRARDPRAAGRRKRSKTANIASVPVKREVTHPALRQISGGAEHWHAPVQYPFPRNVTHGVPASA